MRTKMILQLFILTIRWRCFPCLKWHFWYKLIIYQNYQTQNKIIEETYLDLNCDRRYGSRYQKYASCIAFYLSHSWLVRLRLSSSKNSDFSKCCFWGNLCQRFFLGKKNNMSWFIHLSWEKSLVQITDSKIINQRFTMKGAPPVGPRFLKNFHPW